MEPEEIYWIDENEKKEEESAAKVRTPPGLSVTAPAENAGESSLLSSPVFSILPAVGGWLTNIAKQLVISKDYFVEQLKKAEEFPHLDIDECSDECLEILRQHKDLPGKVHLHHLQPGETVESVASLYRMDISHLMEINQLKDDATHKKSLFVYQADEIEHPTMKHSRSPKHSPLHEPSANSWKEHALLVTRDEVIRGEISIDEHTIGFWPEDDGFHGPVLRGHIIIEFSEVVRFLAPTILPFPGRKMGQFGEMKYLRIISKRHELHLMISETSDMLARLETKLHMKVSVENEVRPASPGSDKSERHHGPVFEELLKKYIDQSAILSADHFRKLRASLPFRFEGRPWKLVYSTLRDGISLNTFYERTYNCGATLLVVQDQHHNIFGAFATESWRIHSRYFGTGESFLFTFYPEFKVYHWTHQNSYFMMAKADSIAVGGGDHFGLWLDSDFQHGSTDHSETFNNRCLTSTSDFDCVHLECWSFDQ